MKKPFALLLALVLCIGLISGCGAKKLSHSHDGLILRLPEDYLDLSDETYAQEWDFMYGLAPITLSGLQDEKSLFDTDLQGYGQLILKSNDLSSTLTEKDGIPTFTYESGSYTYVVTLWETKDAYWTVQAYCPTADFQEVKDSMWDILADIKV